MKKLNLINTVYGELTVIKEHSKTRSGSVRYVCKCTCGNEKNVLQTHLRQGNITNCGCKRKRNSSHSAWKGFGDISGNVWYNKVVASAKGSKRRKPLELTIDVKYGWELFLKQNKKCALSGVDLCFSLTTNGITTASLDRIDSSKGYIEGNVQWVHKDVNMMKRTYSQEYFIEMCKKITENN